MAADSGTAVPPACAANYSALTPLPFLQRSAEVHPNRPAVVYSHDGYSRTYTWQQTYSRCRQFASALRSKGIGRGDVVSVIAPNIPELYELHFGVAMAGGAVLNTINIRLNAAAVATILKHNGASVLIYDEEFFPVVAEALNTIGASGNRKPLLLIVIDHYCRRTNTLAAASGANPSKELSSAIEYNAFLAEGDPKAPWEWPVDELQPISVNYTSGTTASPKGVVYSHRGAYLNALSSLLLMGLQQGAVYLWTLPMFHCNGWSFTWALAAASGTNICLRNVVAAAVFDSIYTHKVTALCGAPVVLKMLIHASASEKKPLQQRVLVVTGGAPPPPTVLQAMDAIGFDVIHSYGLTETYGPATVCEWKEEWLDLSPEELGRVKARQGVRHLALQEVDVMDPKTLLPVARDGRQIGEVMLRGNTVMLGYLHDADATKLAFEGGWLHTGDLAVCHPDGYIELRDRCKDIIISGGENISSIEVENTIIRHPDVLEAAVVARPDERWGESPCAFIVLEEDANGKGRKVTEDDIINFCRQQLPKFMVPRTVIFSPLPKTSTGKLQKFVLRERARAMGRLRDSSLISKL